jgi:hypothetical protein
MRLAALALATGGLLVVGCRTGVREERLPETGATLEGTVTYNDEQVLVAMIVVQGEKGASTTFIGDDGRYKVENAPLGTVHIAVNTENGKAQMTGKMMAQSQGKGSLPKMIDVPARYGDPSTSGITTTINKGSNNFVIAIPK